MWNERVTSLLEADATLAVLAHGLLSSMASVSTAVDVLIEVQDHCGGLPPGSAERMFKPFMQHGDNKSGLGLGLSIARQSIEADAGTLSVRDVPGIGCVFTIALPRRLAA